MHSSPNTIRDVHCYIKDIQPPFETISSEMPLKMLIRKSDTEYSSSIEPGKEEYFDIFVHTIFSWDRSNNIWFRYKKNPPDLRCDPDGHIITVEISAYGQTSKEERFKIYISGDSPVMRRLDS